MIAMELSKKTQRETLIVLALCGVFALTLFGALKNAGVFLPRASGRVPPVPSSQTAHPMTLTKPAAPSPTAARSAAGTPLVRPSDQTIYTAHDLRDPLLSLLPEPPNPAATPQGHHPTAVAAAATPPRTLLLQGIIWGGPQPQAIIDDEVYGVGDVVQGAAITAIGQEGITVEIEGQARQVAIQHGAAEPLQPPMSKRRPGRR